MVVFPEFPASASGSPCRTRSPSPTRSVPCRRCAKNDEETGVELDDDDVSRRVGELGHEVRAVSVFEVVAGDDHRAVRGRHQRLLPAMDRRIRIARIAWIRENPATFQPDEIEGEPLVVGREMVALQRTVTALQHEPLPLERWSDLYCGGRSPDKGAAEIECQDQGARRHDEGGPGVRPARNEEGCRDPKQADADHYPEQGGQLRRPGKNRTTRDGGRRPEARPPHRLEEVGPILPSPKSTKSPQQPRMKTPLPRQPDSARDRPDGAEQQHQRERLVAVETNETEGEQSRETQQRQQGRDDCVGVFPHPASGS